MLVATEQPDDPGIEVAYCHTCKDVRNCKVNGGGIAMRDGEEVRSLWLECLGCEATIIIIQED